MSIIDRPYKLRSAHWHFARVSRPTRTAIRTDDDDDADQDGNETKSRKSYFQLRRRVAFYTWTTLGVMNICIGNTYWNWHPSDRLVGHAWQVFMWTVITVFILFPFDESNIAMEQIWFNWAYKSKPFNIVQVGFSSDCAPKGQNVSIWPTQNMYTFSFEYILNTQYETYFRS